MIVQKNYRIPQACLTKYSIVRQVYKNSPSFSNQQIDARTSRTPSRIFGTAQRGWRTRVTDDKCRDNDQSVGMRRNRDDLPLLDSSSHVVIKRVMREDTSAVCRQFMARHMQASLFITLFSIVATTINQQFGGDS
jgi:hypothetical protein